MRRLAATALCLTAALVAPWPAGAQPPSGIVRPDSEEGLSIRKRRIS